MITSIRLDTSTIGRSAKSGWSNIDAQIFTDDDRLITLHNLTPVQADFVRKAQRALSRSIEDGEMTPKLTVWDTKKHTHTIDIPLPEFPL